LERIHQYLGNVIEFDEDAFPTELRDQTATTVNSKSTAENNFTSLDLSPPPLIMAA
jgi:hypothetical protein